MDQASSYATGFFYAYLLPNVTINLCFNVSTISMKMDNEGLFLTEI